LHLAVKWSDALEILVAITSTLMKRTQEVALNTPVVKKSVRTVLRLTSTLMKVPARTGAAVTVTATVEGPARMLAGAKGSLERRQLRSLAQAKTTSSMKVLVSINARTTATVTERGTAQGLDIATLRQRRSL